MSFTLSTFRVAAIVREPAHILSRFVAWHLTAGASGITLFFDDPDDPAIRACGADPRVTAVPCTPAFWAGIGVDPAERFTLRQNAAITSAYHATAEDWLLVIDADELAYLRDGRFADLLAAQPADIRSIRIEPAEYVHATGGGASFRLPITKQAVNRIYGAESDLFRKRRGLVGHMAGKSFHRTGQTDIRLRQHWAVDASEEPVPAAQIGRAEGAYLLHYLAPDFALWREKIEWRLSASGFPGAARQRIEAILGAEADRETAFASLYDRLHRIDDALAAELRAEGGLLELSPEFGPATA